ncbi:transcriptional regulator BetI [Algirhabdus cladophorae]|uniref:choline-binding transcriptional repressor BetI n=1 Tax=Algirhabdus cladophorae TaxID=3377108 RepID=UPI003B84A6B1
MPKLGMEPIRREALVLATITEIGEQGTLDVTVSQIAKRAGVSSGLAHHYFGGKDQIFTAAMRHILKEYARAVGMAMKSKIGPRDRVEAIIRASFSEEQFDPVLVSAWTNFYVASQTSKDAKRLLRIYQSRLLSNLAYELRPLLGHKATHCAQGIAAMIDGLYIRRALGDDGIDPAHLVLAYLNAQLGTH